MNGRPSHLQTESVTGHGSRITSADIHLRNYDVDSTHSVWVNVVADGEQVFDDTYRLRPGESHSIAGVVPPGEYDVEVSVDELRREVRRCQIGTDPRRTAHVEMGNGVVSITDGIY